MSLAERTFYLSEFLEALPGASAVLLWFGALLWVASMFGPGL